MLDIKTKIENYIDNIFKTSPFRQKDVLKLSNDHLMRCYIRDQHLLEIGIRKNYYDRSYKKGWPLLVKFDSKLNKPYEDIVEEILEIGIMIQGIKDERSWMIQKILTDRQEDINRVLNYFDIDSVTIKKEDGTLVNTEDLDYYIVLSAIRDSFLTDDLFIFYICILMGIFKTYEDCLVKSIQPILDDGLNIKPKTRNITRFNAPKTGAQFFGTDSRFIDYSLSGHKDNYNNAQMIAKKLDRFCSIDEDPSELLFWLKRYQLRPTFRPWQESLHYVDPFSWI